MSPTAPPIHWIDVPQVEDARWSAARLVAHWAAQIPGAFAERLPPADDLGHTALTWAPEHEAFLSGLSAARAALRVGLRLRDLSILLVDGRGRLLDRLPLEGHTLAEGLGWVS